MQDTVDRNRQWTEQETEEHCRVWAAIYMIAFPYFLFYFPGTPLGKWLFGILSHILQ